MNKNNRHGCNSNRGDCCYSHSINDIICIRLRFKLLHYWLGRQSGDIYWRQKIRHLQSGKCLIRSYNEYQSGNV